MRRREWRDSPVAVGLASLAVGPVWVGITGAGVSPRVAAAFAILLLSAVAWIAAPRLHPVSTFLSTRPWHAASGAIAVSIAATFTIQLAVFMHDPQRREWSVRPHSDFYAAHACLRGPLEAAERASRGENAYAISSPTAGARASLTTDAFLYSPAFLLVPRTLMLIGDDFVALQRVWFAVQAVTTLAALLLVATYVGGPYGTRAIWAIPFFFFVPPFLLNLQIGNVQITVLAAAMTGAVLLYSGRVKTGSALLALAIIAKLFPAVLVAYLVGQRRWRVAAWTAGWCALLTLASVALFGPNPLRDYLAALPAISNGSSPGTAIWTDNLWLAPSNHSIYGATRKLVALGVSFVTPQIERNVQSVYGIAVLAFAVLVGAITRADSNDERTRLGQVIVWLALLSLASFRSPFLPDGYAYVGTLWLVTLVQASRLNVTWQDAVALAGAWILLTPIYGGEDVVPRPFRLFVAITLMTQGLVIAASVGAVWMECRPYVSADDPQALPESIERLPA